MSFISPFYSTYFVISQLFLFLLAPAHIAYILFVKVIIIMHRGFPWNHKTTFQCVPDPCKPCISPEWNINYILSLNNRNLQWRSKILVLFSCCPNLCNINFRDNLYIRICQTLPIVPLLYRKWIWFPVRKWETVLTSELNSWITVLYLICIVVF